MDEEKEDFRNSDFRNSFKFHGGYVPNKDLTRVDKGQGNP